MQGLILCDADCSAPPLTSTIRPPRLSRVEEALRPRAPLKPVKREVRESESDSVEFVVDEDIEQEVKLKRTVKIEPYPRPRGIHVLRRGTRPGRNGLPHSSFVPGASQHAWPSGPATRMRTTKGLQVSP